MFNNSNIEKMKNSERNYTVDYQDYEGDEYSETFETIREARECIENVRANGGSITSKWTHDSDGHLVARTF